MTSNIFYFKENRHYTYICSNAFPVIQISGYSGTAGDAMTAFHNNMYFTTKDADNDVGNRNCASTFKGTVYYTFR